MLIIVGNAIGRRKHRAFIPLKERALRQPILRQSAVNELLFGYVGVRSQSKHDFLNVRTKGELSQQKVGKPLKINVRLGDYAWKHKTTWGFFVILMYELP